MLLANKVNILLVFYKIICLVQFCSVRNLPVNNAVW